MFSCEDDSFTTSFFFFGCPVMIVLVILLSEFSYWIFIRVDDFCFLYRELGRENERRIGKEFSEGPCSYLPGQQQHKIS